MRSLFLAQLHQAKRDLAETPNAPDDMHGMTSVLSLLPTRIRWAIGIATVLISILCLSPLVLPPAAHSFLADCTSIVAAGLAAWWSFAAVRRSSPQAQAWLLIGVALLAYTIASAIWFIDAQILGRHPAGSWADVFFILFYPLLLAGIFRLPRQSLRRHDRTILILDLSIASIGMLMVLATLVVLPYFATREADAPWWTVATALGYPTGDLLALWAAIAVLVMRIDPFQRRAGKLLALGACIHIAANLFYAYQTLHGTYVNGNWLGILWHLATLTFGIAATCVEAPSTQVKTTTDIQRRPAVTSLMVAFSCLIIAWLAVASAGGPGIDLADVGMGVMLVLVLIRLNAGLIDNRQLNQALVQVNNKLDQRVIQRTEDLVVANQALRSEMAERVETEQQLRERDQQLQDAQRLESLGRLAGGISHDMNNILAVIGGHAELIAQASASDNPNRVWAERIQLAVERGSGMTRQLLAFGRHDGTKAEIIDANVLVQEVADLLPALLASTITVQVQRTTSPAWIRLDPVQLHQIVLNLCVNARDAMPDGGRLGLAVRHIESPRRQIDMTVSDTGTGIPDAIRAHIFEPFFTTKSPGHGTGLGLSVVHSLVTAAGGTVVAERAEPHGTCFRVTVPAAEHAPLHAAAPLAPAGQVLAGRFILLVDDEATIRDFVGEILRGAGAQVCACGDATEARAAATTQRPDLVVTDATMPGMDGYSLLAHLRQRFPGLPGVVISGWSDATATAGDGPTQHLAKPFRGHELIQAICAVLPPAVPLPAPPTP